MKTHLILFLLSISLFSATGYAQTARLQRQGTATQLIVDGKPFLVLGGELGNSSAASAQDIERIFPKLQRMGLNTVLVPAYWELTEPSEGVFDFTLTDKVLEQARKYDLKVIFLWFGAWKNSMSCYAPLWFKENSQKYPRVHTRNGKPLEIASPFSENVYQADHRAFYHWMEYIAANDKEEGTVLMIQIENEIGMLEEARDYSPEADKAFHTDVPAVLTEYLQKNKKKLHPQLLKKWENQGCRKQGMWQELFGDDLYTDELFMAWHYARYVERLAQSARSIYPVPLYVNAALNSRGRKPGEYPSAGPLAHLIDIWHCAAPSIDLLSPDLYDKGFKDWVAQYHRPDNPLFIPEIRLGDNDGVRAFYAFAEHDALGFSPFSIEDYSDRVDAPLTQSYRVLKELMPLLAKYQGKGVMHGLLFDEEDKECILTEGDLVLTCRHNFTLPWDPRATDGTPWPEGGGLVLKLAQDEYLVAGSGIVIEFAKRWEKNQLKEDRKLGEDGFALQHALSDSPIKGNISSGFSTGKESPAKVSLPSGRKNRCGIGLVDEVNIDPEGNFHPIRRLNGDQTHQGRHVRISMGDWKILHVKLYEYQ